MGTGCLANSKEGRGTGPEIHVSTPATRRFHAGLSGICKGVESRRNWLLRLDSVPLATSEASGCATPQASLRTNLAKRGWLLRLDSNQQPSG